MERCCFNDRIVENLKLISTQCIIWVNMSQQIELEGKPCIVEKVVNWLNRHADNLEIIAKREQELNSLRRMRRQLGLKGNRYSLPGDM
jgi:hypothetical protein